MKKQIIINRGTDTPHQNLGTIELFIDDVLHFAAVKLELPYKDNKRRISSIKKGRYLADIYYSKSKGRVLLLKNVENRTYIEVHAGNYYTQILGCVIIGRRFKFINKDKVLDIAESKETLNALLSYIDDDEEVEVFVR